MQPQPITYPYQCLLFQSRHTSIEYKHRLNPVCEKLAHPVKYSKQMGIWKGAMLSIPVAFQDLKQVHTSTQII